MRYLLLGFLCGLLADYHAQPLYIVVIAFVVGSIGGLVFGFLLSEAGYLIERDTDA